MGREFRVLLDEIDHRRIRESIPRDDPKSMEELLKRLPGYIKGSAYEYNLNGGGFNCCIWLNGYDLDILVYGSASEEPIIQMLFEYLMDICGRFRIEEK